MVSSLSAAPAISISVVVLVVWLVSHDDLPEIFGPHESCTLLLFTAYAIVRTVPSANRPNWREKKKSSGGRSASSASASTSDSLEESSVSPAPSGPAR